MNKKVSLKEIVGTKIVYAIILTSYYWMWARTDWKDWYETVQSMLGAFLFSFFALQMIRISKYKKEGIDEMAEQNLKRCDSICLKLLVGVMVAVAFGAAILGHANVVSTGFIGWTIVLSMPSFLYFEIRIICKVKKEKRKTPSMDCTVSYQSFQSVLAHIQ